MTYLFDLTPQCSHATLPLNVAGNAFDVKGLKFTCSKCGTPAHVNTAEEVGLDPSDPNFENRIQELTAGFSCPSFYIGIVTDGQLRLEPRMRQQITINFAVFCKTCHKGIPVDAKLRETLKQEHKDHDVLIGPVGDTVLSAKLRKLFRQSLEQFLGEPVKDEGEGKC